MAIQRGRGAAQDRVAQRPSFCLLTAAVAETLLVYEKPDHLQATSLSFAAAVDVNVSASAATVTS